MPSVAAVIGSIFRWTGAWAFAVVASSGVLMAGFMIAAGVVPETVGAWVGFAFVVMLYIAMIATVPAIILTALLRLSRLPRGWTDALAFALAAPVLYHAVILEGDFSPASFALADPIFAAGGAVAGFVYWWLAGRPAPPYPGWFGPD